MRPAALAVLTLTACVAADQPVLTAGPTLTSCDAVLTRTSDLQACDFDGVCSWSDPADPDGMACCTYFAVCAEGRLLVEPMCPGDCQACTQDDQCPAGVAWCDGVSCTTCPDSSMCADCAPGTVPIERNGCNTCACAPPSQCSDPLGCTGPDESCYRGQVCADGCAPGELTCCANVCAAPGCSEPAPLGCLTDCPMDMSCLQCMASGCACSNGVWQCTAVCSDVVGPCFVPGA